MKIISFVILITPLLLTNRIVFEKINDSKFSSAEIIDEHILISSNGAISKYSYDFKLISEYAVEGLILESKSKIHKIGTTMLIIESSRAIYLLENNAIKFTINYDSLSYFRQLLVINSNTFLVLNVELTTSIISYSLYNTESNIPIKTIKSNKGYKHYSCSLSKLSSNTFISCFLTDDTDLYYNIFDEELNQIIEETKIENVPEIDIRTNYLYSISITDTKLVLLLIKNNDYVNYLYKSYLVILELKESTYPGTYRIDKIGPEENFVLYDKTYSGNEIFHIKKINEEEFVVAFPIDESKKEFYFSFCEYKNGILSVKEGYENIPLSFQYQIHGLNFLKINSDYAISFYYFNNEEEEEFKETYLSYLTTKSCIDFKISIHMNKVKEIDFSKYVTLNLISPEPDYQKMKIDNTDAPSISFFYDSNPFDKEQFYEYNKWSTNSGNVHGDFEIHYSIYSSNDYKISTCKIHFEIFDSEDTTEEIEEVDTTEVIEATDNVVETESKDTTESTEPSSTVNPSEEAIISSKITDNDEITDINYNNITEEQKIQYADIIVEREIKSKVEELKDNSLVNFENNTLYEAENYKINFYNTSGVSQKSVLEKEGVCNVNLLNCENILKSKYNIPEHEVLNIIKVEIKRRDTISMQVEYEVYSEDLRLLNLNYCKDEIIRVSIPYDLKLFKKNNFRKLSEEINLEEKYKLGLKFGYDILNSNSPFYNDICTLFDSEYSTDLIIEDRKKYYYMPQLFCEDTCTYSSYNITNNKVNCDCFTKTEPKYNIFFRNFLNTTTDSSFEKKISNVNFKVMQCIGKGFQNFSKNIGVYIILVIFLCFIAVSILAILIGNKVVLKEGETEAEIKVEDKNTSINDNLIIMDYDLALKKDDRKYYQMYFETIKYNHLIYYTFIDKIFEKNFFLKLMMFLFFVTLLFLFNCIFFLDKYFSKIYLNEGKYNFCDELPMAFVSTLICLLINMGIKIFFKTNHKRKLKSIRQIRNSSNNLNKKEDEEVLAISEIKYNKNKRILIFAFISIIIIIFVFFYVASFSGIFINDQKFLLLRIIFSLIISLILPFILCLIYAFLRSIGLKYQKELVYNISLILQNY